MNIFPNPHVSERPYRNLSPPPKFRPFQLKKHFKLYMPCFLKYSSARKTY